MIATLIKRRKDLIGWIEGEKYDKDASEIFHLLACDLCLPNTQTSIASVIIASVERQEEKLAKKEKQQKDREYMRQVREDLRDKAQEAKELAKFERQTRQQVLAQEKENTLATKELDKKQQSKNLISFLQLPTQKNGIEYGAKKYCLWKDLKSHLLEEGFQNLTSKTRELAIMKLSLKEENVACRICYVRTVSECLGNHQKQRSKIWIVSGCCLKPIIIM